MASTPDTVTAIAAALQNPVEAPIMAQPGDSAPERGDGQYERPPLPADCPVKPLGITADIGGSQKCYYLDTNGQLVGLEAGNRHGKNSLIALFGKQSSWLEANYPQWSKPVTKLDRKTGIEEIVRPSRIVGFDQAEASRVLIEACTEKGIFDPTGKIRGRGAHRGRNGSLILHCGDKILIARQRINGEPDGWQWINPGVHDGYVYPAGAPLPRPHAEAVDEKPAQIVLKQLQTWNFRRELLDPMLALGWIAAAMVGGALHWRPTLWVTGGRGTGKSTLDGEPGVDTGFIGHLLGEARMSSSDTTSAAIRQTLRNATIPVMIDELEPDADQGRVKTLIELARIASSGAKGQRGGTDQQATEFTLRSCFLFSSILMPQLQPQDRSRIAVLELGKLPEGAAKPAFRAMNLPLLGAKIFRRMVDGWHRFGETLDRYQAALAAGGHDARACDQFGTLLACADLLLYDVLPDDELTAHWAGQCDRRTMGEISDAVSDEMACIHHILTSMVQARGGDEREALGSWIGNAVHGEVGGLADEKARRRLQEIGLKIVNAHPLDAVDDKGAVRWGAKDYMPGEPGFLAVATSHQALGGLFAGTKWQGGVWSQSLARTEGAIRCRKVKFGRLALGGVLVPLYAVLDELELPPVSRPEGMAGWMKEKAGA